MSPNILTETERFAGTVSHPTIVVLTIVSFILILLMNIRHSMIFLILVSMMVPINKGFEIFNLNFLIFRLLLIAGWIKIIFNKNLKLGKMEKTDKTIIYWVIISFIAYIFQKYTFSTYVYPLGFAYNAIGIYFLYRIIIKKEEDISNILNAFAIVSAVIAVFMIIEQWTAKNLIYVFWGGANQFSQVRMGRIRSQGPFAHAINAGVFGATMFPLFFSMWRSKWGSAFFGIIGTLSACVLIITSSSSTPLIAFVAGFAALLFWPLRKQMRMVRYGILFAVVFLQIIMISPVWAIIKQFSVIKGSSGWHRYELVNNLINHFNDWFLFGFPTPALWGEGMHDKVNQYYLEAVNGGFFKLILFIIIIVFNFKILGKNIKISTDDSSQKKFWAFGSSLVASLVAFFGVSYWDQMLFVWYLFLALITSTCVIYGDGKHLTVDKVSNKLGEGPRSP